MRSRNIKPGFFKDDLLAECDPLARLLFVGLWCLADREGRLECRSKKIKAEILPYDNCDVLKLLDQLIDKHFIVVYKYDDAYFIEIPMFLQHQHCHVKEMPSTIPAPDETESCTVLKRPLIDSLLLNTEYPLRKSRTKPIPRLDESFENFWQAYPKKKSKGEAEKAWSKITFVNGLYESIISKVELLKQSPDWQKDNGQWIPHPSTWLNRKGWEDEVELSKPTPTPVYTPTRRDEESWAKEWRGMK